MIREDGTENIKRTDFDGKFELITTKDTCTTTVSYFGYKPESFHITSDTTLMIKIIEDSMGGGNTKWRSIGASYDAMNTKFGINISNGMDESPLIHFEDYSEDLMWKASVQSDFKNDYVLEGNIGWRYPQFLWKRLSWVTANYKHYDYSEKETFKGNYFSIAGAVYSKLVRASIVVEPAYQSLNNQNNWGLNLGLRNGSYIHQYYAQVSAGYFGDYWTLSAKAYIHLHRTIGVQVAYERIHKFDFLNIGLNYIFTK